MASKRAPIPAPDGVASDDPVISTPDRPATAKLAALKAARQANSGLVVLPTVPLAVLNGAKLAPPGNANNGFAIKSASLDLVEAWLRSIVAAGGSKGDLIIAWNQWRPGDTSGAKRALQAKHDALMIEAERQHGELQMAAAREALPDRQAAQQASDLRAARVEAEKAEKVAAEKRAKVQQIEGAAA